MFINKKDLIKAVAEDLGKTQVEVSAIVQTFFDFIKKGLRGNGDIRMTGLARFRVVNRKATVKQNPQTGDKINVPAKRVVKVTCGKFFNL
ncbi:MAG: hypothetical protein RLY43_655 [Bacteroidota bacterium]|jgi:DNA-binding protein HU-beta